MKHIILVFLSIVLFFQTFVCGEDQEIRTWTTVPNSSGKVFKAKGYLKDVSEDGQSVVLVINGKEKTVKIIRLIQEDKDYIEEFKENQEFQRENMDEEFEDSDQELQTPQPEEQGDTLPQEGEMFTFYDKELPISRPIFGIYLGETIEGLAKRMPVTKSEYEPRTEKFLETYEVNFNDDFVEEITAVASQGRVIQIIITMKDHSFENYEAVTDEINKKYKLVNLDRIDEQENGAKIKVFTGYIVGSGGLIYYTYTQMDEIHNEVISKYRTSKAGGRL